MVMIFLNYYFFSIAKVYFKLIPVYILYLLGLVITAIFVNWQCHSVHKYYLC